MNITGKPIMLDIVPSVGESYELGCNIRKMIPRRAKTLAATKMLQGLSDTESEDSKNKAKDPEYEGGDDGYDTISSESIVGSDDDLDDDFDNDDKDSSDEVGQSDDFSCSAYCPAFPEKFAGVNDDMCVDEFLIPSDYECAGI